MAASRSPIAVSTCTARPSTRLSRSARCILRCAWTPSAARRACCLTVWLPISALPRFVSVAVRPNEWPTGAHRRSPAAVPPPVGHHHPGPPSKSAPLRPPTTGTNPDVPRRRLRPSSASDDHEVRRTSPLLASPTPCPTHLLHYR